MLRYYKTFLLVPNLLVDTSSGCVNSHHTFQQCKGDPETTKKWCRVIKIPFNSKVLGT